MSIFSSRKERLLAALGVCTMTCALLIFGFVPPQPAVYFAAAVLMGVSAVLNVNTLLLAR